MEDIRTYQFEDEQRNVRRDEESTLRMIRDVDAATQEEEVPFHVPRD